MIQVRELRVDYDEVCAVRDLSLDIPAGDIYGLIGPNGAGKTTTLRAMAGLLEPTYGEITLNGLDLATRHEEAVQQVGFMPDFAPVYEDLTVFEFLDLFAASYGIPADARAAVIDEHLMMVELSEKRDALTAGLSRGMRQRLLLAKTLIPNPRIVLLDEPASGMDPHGRVLLKQILRRLGAEGKAVLISSHILTELSEFCTSVGVMERGRLVVSGRVDEVTARVIGQVMLHIHVLDGVAPCTDVLAATPFISAVREEDGHFSMASTGTLDDESALLTALVSAGVRIAAFAREKEDLEDVFMRIGAREVS